MDTLKTFPLIFALIAVSSTKNQLFAAPSTPAETPRDAPTANVRTAPKDPVQRLVDKLSSPDENTQSSALNGLVLGNFPPERVVPIYHRLLSSQYKYLRQGGANALARHGEKARVAVPELLNLLETDTYDYASIEAARALAKIAPQNPAVIMALTRTSQTWGSVGIAAIESLGEIGSPARDAAPTLVRLLGNQPGNARSSSKAFEALGKITQSRSGLSVSQAAILLNKLDAAPIEQTAAAFAILRDQGASRDIIPKLVQIINERPEPHFQYAAIGVLGKIGPGSNEDAVRALVLALNRNALQYAAEKALYFVGNGDQNAVVPLAEALGDPDSRVRLIAARALSRIGPTAQAAAPALIKALQEEFASKNPSLWVVPPVAQTLAAIGPQASAVAPDILNLLELPAPPQRSSFRANLFGVLAAIGIPTQTAERQRTLKLVVEGLQDKSSDVRAGAARVAGVLGQDAAPAVPHLIEMLNFAFRERALSQLFDGIYLSLLYPTQERRADLNAFDTARSVGATTPRLEAIRALARIGTAANSAIPILNRYAQSRDGEPVYSFYREDAREALRFIQQP